MRVEIQERLKSTAIKFDLGAFDINPTLTDNQKAMVGNLLYFLMRAQTLDFLEVIFIK